MHREETNITSAQERPERRPISALIYWHELISLTCHGTRQGVGHALVSGISASVQGRSPTALDRFSDHRLERAPHPRWEFRAVGDNSYSHYVTQRLCISILNLLRRLFPLQQKAHTPMPSPQPAPTPATAARLLPDRRGRPVGLAEGCPDRQARASGSSSGAKGRLFGLT